MKTPAGLITLLLALMLSLTGPVLAQDQPAQEKPVPVDQLPPLNLPPMPGEEDVDEDEPLPTGEDGEVVEIPPPPPPLPLPEGPAVVKPNLPEGYRFFKLVYDGKLVGYSSFNVTGSMGLAGESFTILESQGKIKLGVGGVDTSTFFGKLMLDRKNLRPSYYKCMQKSDGAAYQVECVYSDTMVAQTNRAGDVKNVHFFNYDETQQAPYLLFNNLWGHLDTFPEHYWLLVRSAVNGGVLQAYDPILRGGGDLVVYEPTVETVEWNGSKVKTRLYPVSDMLGTLLARVRVRDSDLELLEVIEVGRGMRMVRSNPDIVSKVDQAKGLDLLPMRVQESNVLFNDPEKLTSLEAEIEMSLRGGQFADHRIPGYRQYFTGELREGYMKGRVNVRTVPREIAYSTKFPLQATVPEEAVQHTRPGPGVESEFPALQIKARELTWKSENTFEAARRLMNFVSQVEEGVSLPSARYALEAGVGNPESKALLLVAMARAVGLPARRVGGLLFREGAFVPHHWAEIWLGPGEGWSAFDPTTVEAGRVGATHIALWESGDVQALDIQVTDYAPRATRTVEFFENELAWPVGEERVYSILRKGEKIGSEVAAVKEITIRDDKELFRFVAESHVTEGNEQVHANGELLLNPVGLPVRFELNNGTESATFNFLSDAARFSHKKGDKESPVKEIPFARGTYVTDQRFLSQWALVVGQAKKPDELWEVGKQLTFHVFVPEELKSHEMTLEVMEPEVVTNEEGQDVTYQRLENELGWIFRLNELGQVVKIEIPQQDLEVVLEETRFKLD